jgi:hypothetical protein
MRRISRINLRQEPRRLGDDTNHKRWAHRDGRSEGPSDHRLRRGFLQEQPAGDSPEVPSSPPRYEEVWKGSSEADGESGTKASANSTRPQEALGGGGRAERT